jgi:DNA-binding transcriptional ArsR family regulator
VETYRVALDALGDPTRRAVFELLGSGGASVGELAARLPVSRPAVSQHLKVLRDAGLVVVHAEGTRRVYALDPAGVAAVRDYFDRFWARSLACFQHAAESSFTATAPHPQPPVEEES